MMVSFEFGFNNPIYSDRLLSLEIIKSHNPETNEENISMITPDVINAGNLHVNSLLLAAHSDYFTRLFSNGMSESQCRVVSVKLTEEEVQCFYHLIRYMYSGHLNEPSDIQSVLILLRLADRFAITSCIKGLVDALHKIPNTLDSCVLVMGLPETLKTSKAIQPVIEHFTIYLTQYFADISSKKTDFLSLTLEAVKVVLDSDTLNVSYEEEVYLYLLDWLNVNCQSVEDQTLAAEELASVIRFPWMTGDFLVDRVGNNPVMASSCCQDFIMEALKFKSFTHSRQQQMMSEKVNHNRFRPRNSLILENYWGNSKTYIMNLSEKNCQVYFEFPLELVICTGQNFQSRPFSLGGKHTFYLEAAHGQVKTSYNQQLTCCIRLVLTSSNLDSSELEGHPPIVAYVLSMKRDYSQCYDTKVAGAVDIQALGKTNKFITFNDMFSGWLIERGFSFPRWNLTINGPVFLRLDLSLKDGGS